MHEEMHVSRPFHELGLELNQLVYRWCEYRDGCEWREMKAKEARDQARSREPSN